jgi:ubiquinone biosynthesis protein
MIAFFRLVKIIHVLAYFHLDELIKPLPYSWLPRLLVKLLPSYWFYYFSDFRKYSINERARLALISLGPIFIKLGQLLATRRDLLDDALADELEKLTEQVPPFNSEQAIAIVEKELAKPVSELFADFERTPMASASIAQVHAATLKSGEAVVLKILRPNIIKTVNRDLKLMAWLAASIEYWLPDTRLLFLQELVENYRDVILGEINLYREAANTIKFRKNALQHNYLYIPKIFPALPLDLSHHLILSEAQESQSFALHLLIQ